MAHPRLPFRQEDHRLPRFDNRASRGNTCRKRDWEETTMTTSVTRRMALLAATASVFARAGQAAPPPEPVTDKLVDAAKKEGTVVFHSSIELSVCQAMID